MSGNKEPWYKDKRKENRRKSPWFDPFEQRLGEYERRRYSGNRRKGWPGPSGH